MNTPRATKFAEQRDQSTQLSLTDVGEDLAREVFVVVDLETTGGPATSAGITEIGAVKVRGGEIIAEFATLVRPPETIPPHITALTGIDESMVRDAPSVAGAVSSFGEFAGDAILVAHNAPYDLGFLKAACAMHDLTWLPRRSVDTARLARVALLPGEVRNCKLATLAAHFRAPVTPNHRALADARATTHVLHCLLERCGSLGVRTFADLRDFLGRVSPAQRAKRHLADGLPAGPGVYTFVDRQGAPLYVGTSTNVRSRVRSYFTASENRARMSEMITIADRVDAIPCATTLEAKVREVRQIASRQPRYNRRSRRAETPWWLQLRDKPHPRLVAVRQTDGHPVPHSWGPFASRSAARAVADTLISLTLAPSASSSAEDLATEELSTVVGGDLREMLTRGWERMRELADQELFEQAARLRDAMAKVSAASERHQRFHSLLGAGRIVAAEPDTRGGWAIAVIDCGRLVAAAHARTGDNPRATARAAVATAESAASGATGEETLLLARWLEGPLTRLVDIDRPLAWPIGSGSPLSSLSITALPGTDSRSSRPVGPAPGKRRVTRIAG
jgi:DNA polymerase-3 subunit epsilon